MDEDPLHSAPSHSLMPARGPYKGFHTADDAADSTDSSSTTSARVWRQELPRWLASLNPGRTAGEYEKAVRYFFETPGVPQELTALSFDLLLAYRGALALRAAPRTRGAAYTWAMHRSSLSARAIAEAETGQALPPDEREAGTPSDGEWPLPEPRPLAPATVNIRLTALRQFLVHCSLMELLPQLSPERIRAALRRLAIEHRRPYQILDEAEWDGFLQAALLPASLTRTPAPAVPVTVDLASSPADNRSRGPWGTPRALRTTNQQDAASATGAPEPGDTGKPPSTVRSRFGLTGIRTAQRDHALVALALATGLRAIELSQLDIGDLQREWQGGHEEWWLILPDAKTKGQKGGRTLPLATSLVETLMTYIRTSGRKWEDATDHMKPLFISVYERRRAPRTGGTPDQGQQPSKDRARLLPGQIARIVDRVEAQWLALRAEEAVRGGTMRAGETRSISTHALRHSTAVALLAGNPASGRPPASVEHVRGWLGHFDIRTTQGYLAHLDARRHRRPFALAPGVSSTAPQPPADDEPAVHAADAQRDATEHPDKT